MTLARLAACSTLLTAVLWAGCGPLDSRARPDEPAPAAQSGAIAGVEAARARTPNGTGGVNAPETLQKPYLVLVSFDGFRHDYLERYDTPNFDRVAADGVTADALIPVYPSLTFPAHYSIATGLYPEHHGLIGNKFYDPARAALYDYRDTATVQDGTWYGGEPIWVTAETQGMVAGAMLFVGTEAAVGGVSPTFWTPYAERGSQRERVDAVLDWLSLSPDRRPHLVTLYFSAVDGAGHRDGPASPAVAEAVQQVDAALGHLLDGIDALPHGEATSIVLVSDHGMAATVADAAVNLGAMVDLQNTRVIVTGPGANIFVEGGDDRAGAVRDAINAVLPGGRAYLRRETPAALRYRDDPRIGDVVVVADNGVMIGMGDDPPPRGMHGWDPGHSDMYGIFLASGPELARGIQIDPIEAVHVYPLLARLLHLTPNPDIDGDLAVLGPVLTE